MSVEVDLKLAADTYELILAHKDLLTQIAQPLLDDIHQHWFAVVLQKTQIAIKLMESGIPGGKNQGRSG